MNFKIFNSFFGRCPTLYEHLGPIYTWCTFTGVKLNNNWTQYFRPTILAV